MIVIGTGGIDTDPVHSLEGDHGTSPVQGHVLDLIHGIGEGMWNVSRVLCSYPECCVLILISNFLGILDFLSKLAKIATGGLFMCILVSLKYFISCLLAKEINLSLGPG